MDIKAQIIQKLDSLNQEELTKKDKPFFLAKNKYLFCLHSYYHM